MTKDAFTDRLVTYINDELLSQGVPPVTEDTNLFSGEVLDSLRLINLLAFIENAVGATIPDEDIVMASFSTPAIIARTFGRRT